MPLQICPSAEELGQEIKRNILCTVPGCGQILPHYGSLKMHLIRGHKQFTEEKDEAVFCTGKRKQTEKKEVCQYHCPGEGCVYQPKSERYFKSFKDLRTHFLRMHGKQRFPCGRSGCKLAFALTHDLQRHQESCGQIFTCEVCDVQYASRMSLHMHCQRKTHHFPVKYKLLKECNQQTKKNSSVSKKVKNVQMSIKTEDSCSQDAAVGMNSQRERGLNEQIFSSDVKQTYKAKKKPWEIIVKPTLLPNPTAVFLNYKSTTSSVPSQIYMVSDSRKSSGSDQFPENNYVLDLSQKRSSVVNSTTQLSLPRKRKRLNAEAQTEIVSITKRRRAAAKRAVSTAATQTGNKRRRNVAQTQTTGDVVLKKAMESAHIPIQKSSTASQVSPRAKIKDFDKTVQNSETQTMNCMRQKRRKKSSICGRRISSTSSTQTAALGQQPDQKCMVSSGTQLVYDPASMSLLEKLEATLAESISTQTIDSYLADGIWQDESHLETSSSQTSRTMRMDQADQALTVDQSVLCSLDFSSNIQPQTSISLDIQTSSDNDLKYMDRTVTSYTAENRLSSLYPQCSTPTSLPTLQHTRCDTATSPLPETYSNTPLSTVPHLPSSMTAQSSLAAYTNTSTSPILFDKGTSYKSNSSKSVHQSTSGVFSFSESMSCRPVTAHTSCTAGNTASEAYRSTSLSLNLKDRSSTATTVANNLCSGNDTTTQTLDSWEFDLTDLTDLDLESSHASMTDIQTCTSDLPDLGDTLDAYSPYSTYTATADNQTCTSDLYISDLFSTSSVQTSDFTAYMNIETQTADTILSDDFLSNIQTQTTGDFLTDFSFSDIQTQTSLRFPAMSTVPQASRASSVETQTTFLTNPAPSSIAGRELTDIETQTLGVELGPDLTDSHTQTTLDGVMSMLTDLRN